MSEHSSHKPVGVADSGLEVTPEFIQILREVGLESLANYYTGVYRLIEE